MGQREGVHGPSTRTYSIECGGVDNEIRKLQHKGNSYTSSNHTPPHLTTTTTTTAAAVRTTTRTTYADAPAALGTFEDGAGVIAQRLDVDLAPRLQVGRRQRVRVPL